MLFVGIFGGGEKADELGCTSPRTCPRCHNAEPWTVFEIHKYFSAFFIPVARWGRRYAASCPVCGETRMFASRDDAVDSIDTAR